MHLSILCSATKYSSFKNSAACLRLSGIVVNAMHWHLDPEVGIYIPAMPLCYWVVTLGKLFTHIASPVFSAPRNWVQKGVFRLDQFNDLTDCLC